MSNMSNIVKYNKIFAEVLGIKIDDNTDLDQIARNEIGAWDSLGHISLVTTIEKDFSIRLTVDEIKKFTSYQAGLDILGNYHIGM